VSWFWPLIASGLQIVIGVDVAGLQCRYRHSARPALSPWAPVAYRTFIEFLFVEAPLWRRRSIEALVERFPDGDERTNEHVDPSSFRQLNRAPRRLTKI